MYNVHYIAHYDEYFGNRPIRRWKVLQKEKKNMVTYFTWEYVLNVSYMIYTGFNMKKNMINYYVDSKGQKNSQIF